MFVSIADSLVAKGRKVGLSEGRRAGLSEGLARAVLHTLERRFSRVSKPTRMRVASCLDEGQLLRWLDRAATASSVAEVFDDGDE